jgi:hypothetical protein
VAMEKSLHYQKVLSILAELNDKRIDLIDSIAHNDEIENARNEISAQLDTYIKCLAARKAEILEEYELLHRDRSMSLHCIIIIIS